MDMVACMQQFSMEEACRAFLERVRWPDGPVCPKCRSVGRASRLRSRPGTWRCCVGSCKAHFSVTAGTLIHRTQVPLTKWFLAIWLIAMSSKGVSGMDTHSRVPARKLADWLDVDDPTAWDMDHRIRRLLTDPNWQKLSGIVEADGHAVGGLPQMYVGGRKDTHSRTSAGKPGDDDPGAGSGGSKRGRGHGRTAVMVAAERGGEVRVRRIATHASIEVGNAVRELIDPSARLITDGLPAYRNVGRTVAAHVTVDHGRQCFSDRAGGHVNTAEGLAAKAAEGLSIGLFRRSVHGTWHWVSRKHPDAYTNECTRHDNRRDIAAVTKVIQALSGLDAGPLGYRDLVACG